MRKICLLALLSTVVFAACTSIEEAMVPENEEEYVKLEDVIPALATMTKAEFEEFCMTHNPDPNQLVVISEISEEESLQTRANTITPWKVEYDWMEDMTFITYRGVTDYTVDATRLKVSVSESMAAAWHIDGGSGIYNLYSWKLTLEYRQARSHSFVTGDYAGIKPSDRNVFGYDLENLGNNTFRAYTIYYQLEKLSANGNVVVDAYTIPSYQKNDPGLFFDTFKWQYSVAGNIIP